MTSDRRELKSKSWNINIYPRKYFFLMGEINHNAIIF